MVTTDYAIQTQNLTRRFKGICAVDNLTLEIPCGIVFGFLGPTGSGKTTTIRMLLGLLEASDGHAEVLGYDVATESQKIRANTGALMEHNGLYERLTAWDNLEFFGHIYGMSAQERNTRIKELLVHMNLWERRNDMVQDWSKGMRQKLAVARAVLHHPPLVILDEPTSGLDLVAAAELRDDLAGLVAHDGVTVFLNTHNLPEAERLCQQVGVIRAGKLLKISSVDELHQSATIQLEINGHNFNHGILSALRAYPEISSVKQNSSNANEQLLVELSQPLDSALLVSTIASAGGQTEEIKHVKSSLEDVFLELLTGEDKL